jgi:hypothetical protein
MFCDVNFATQFTTGIWYILAQDNVDADTLFLVVSVT